MAGFNKPQVRDKAGYLPKPTWTSAKNPSTDATNINPQAAIIPKNAPVRGGAQDTGGPPKVYGPGDEK